MLRLRVYSPTDKADEVLATLERHPGVRHIVRSGMTSDGSGEYLSADLRPEVADDLLAHLTRLGLHDDDVMVQRVDVAGPPRQDEHDRRWDDRNDALVWAEVVDEARENMRARSTYFVYMIAAGVIAAFGVIQRSSILIVGAMAVSPDLMPLSAACVSFVARRPRYAARAVATMVSGLVVASLAALVLTALLRITGYLAADFDVSQGFLGSLSEVDVGTIGVAAAAGVAAMLAFETRASAAVGVAISVTTIPAAADAGVAFAVGDRARALGALGVLATNITTLVVVGTTTLTVQRRLDRGPRRQHPLGGPR
jgi:uncharacterized hydrophobic protein (TIGR00271 family)